jgi:hypothetical protein
VADGTGKAVKNRFLIFVDMTVGMGNAVGVHIGMIVDVIVRMVGHKPTSFCVFLMIPYFMKTCKPPKGMFL